jgi:UDPglucose--hexose-1-phosphate uridylyltransferase
MLNELRSDYFLDRQVIIAVGRGKRPSDIKVTPSTESEPAKGCFFCPGNEAMTPPESYRVEEAGKWVIRVFPNKFPAVTIEAGNVADELMPAYGYHEVVVEEQDHTKTLGDLSTERIARVIEVYSQRVRYMLTDKRIKYALVFKNHGKVAGASLAHTHTQIISLPVVPRLVKEETSAAKRYSLKNGTCPLCDAWKKESTGPRAIWADDNAVVFAPYASRSSFEAWVMPKRHIRSLDDLDSTQRLSLAAALKHVLSRLRSGLGDPPYNMCLHMSPADGDLHLHFEILPHLSTWAGFELGSDIIINTMAPETAAEFYRSK